MNINDYLEGLERCSTMLQTADELLANDEANQARANVQYVLGYLSAAQFYKEKEQ